MLAKGADWLNRRRILYYEDLDEYGLETETADDVADSRLEQEKIPTAYVNDAISGLDFPNIKKEYPYNRLLPYMENLSA